jgi:hypothetical protein
LHPVFSASAGLGKAQPPTGPASNKEMRTILVMLVATILVGTARRSKHSRGLL